MDKGIRAFTRTFFASENTKRIAGEVYTGHKANTLFRAAVMAELMTQFGVSVASAATHYNDALIAVRTATPELVSGLGRPEDKKGGRKKAAVVEPAAATTDDEPTITNSALVIDALETVDTAEVPTEKELLPA